MESWPFVTTESTLTEAIAFIAKLTRRTEESAPESNRRVRDHIRKAIGRKRKPRFDAPRDSSARVGEVFWQWAKVEWPILCTVHGFPFVTVGQLSGSASLTFKCSGYIYSTPSDPEQLKEEYHKAHSRIRELAEENRNLANINARLATHLQSVEAQLDVYVQREARLKVSASKRGKLGKGVPHRRR